MKLEFLGTSHGVPSDTRYCNSMLLTCGDAKYLFDAGAPVADILTRKGIPFTDLRATFITHLHGDHYFGLLGLLDLSNWYYTKAAYATYLPEERGCDLARQYVETTSSIKLREDALPLYTYEEGEIYCDENIKVRAVRTQHAAASFLSYGFLIEGEGKRIYLTGDMHSNLSDFPAFLLEEEVDLLVTEMAHCKVETLFEKLQACHAKHTVINHVFPVEHIQDALALRHTVKGELSIACDNDTFVI